ncbi:MAG: CoA transferase [Pseudomonadota bacterium]
MRITLGERATGPLAGIKVADFSAVFSGPICAAMLGDQGADVIKVEAFTGDMMRRGLPQSNGLGSAFTTMNRNKRSLCLDLQKPQGKEVAQRLIQSSDVVVENFRPGVMDRLGLGYDQFRHTQPKLVYASINGVGAYGPYANRRVYDAVIQAISGFASLKGDGAPEMVNSLVCDKVTSLTAAEAIVAALFQAERSGQGQRVEVSMLDAALSFLWPDTMNNFTFLEPDVEQVPYLDHSIFLHQTKDGWIATMPVQNVEFLATFRALNQGQLAEDPRFADQTSRARHRTELRELMEFAYRQFTTDELAIRFEAEDVPYSLVNDRADVINDPQVEAMQALLTYQHPQAGLVRTPRPAAQYSNTPSNIRIHTPSLGEHNHSILSELGYSETEIASLQEDHIVQTGDSGQ